MKILEKIGKSDTRMAFLAIATFAMTALLVYVSVYKPYKAKKDSAAGVHPTGALA